MKEINTLKVTLIGMGAMGAFFGPGLYDTLPKGQFRILASGARKERIEKRGFVINGTQYNFPIIEPETLDDPADLIIIAVKDTALDQAIRDIKNQINENTQIMCVMNGIDSEEKVAAVYGWEHVLYSYMRVSIEMNDGVANFDPNWGGKVHFGEAKNQEPYTDRVQQIKALLSEAGIDYRIENDMLRGLWFKFMCNVGENLTCALLKVPYGAFHVSDHANEIRRAAMKEVLALAKAKGINLTMDDLVRQEETVKRIPGKNKPSTYQDLVKNRATEVNMFAGKVVEMGKEYGIDTPINWLFYHGIRVHEENNLGMFEAMKGDQ